VSASYPADAWHTFYGRGVWPTGECGDDGVMIEGADRRSYAALSCYLREERQERGLPEDADVKRPRVRRFHTECGCTPEQHAKHDQNGAGVCEDCKHWGLPPCEPELYSWSPELAGINEPGLPVLWVDW